MAASFCPDCTLCPRLASFLVKTKRDIAARKNVEEDLQRLIPGATLLSCSGFGDAIIKRMKAA